MAKVTSVTGVSATRKNNKFTVKWSWYLPKKSDSVTDQKMLVHIGWLTSDNVENGSQKEFSLSKSAKSKTLDERDYGYLDLEEYFNGRKRVLKSVQFVVMIKTKKTSGWQKEGSYTYKFSAPAKPSLSKSTIDTYTRRFTWTGKTTDSGKNPAWGVEWQTYLQYMPTANDKSDMNKMMDRVKPTSHYDPDLTNYHQVQESSAVSAADSNLRVFRVRTYGAGGVSAWALSYQLYAEPYPSDTPYVEIHKKTNTSFAVNAYFNNPNTPAHRIDQVVAQWQIATPLANMEAPASGWQNGRTFDDYKKSNKRYTPNVTPTVGKLPSNMTAGRVVGSWNEEDEPVYYEELISWEINNESIGTDQCFFFRVLNKYGAFETAGPAVIAQNGYGVLAQPTLEEVIPNDEEHTVQIRVTNNSAVPDSHIVVNFVAKDNSVTPLGVIYGSGTATFQYPSDTMEYKTVGIIAHVGSVADNGEIYTTLMSSVADYDSGILPVAPSEITLEQTERVGAMLVQWEWEWNEADQAEVSWSDYQYAWESTDEPETYIVSKVNASKLYITDLETGIPIYVRVRYISGYGDDASYGPYSAQHSLVLESAPNKPSVRLSRYVIPQTGETKVTWVYTTNDGTTQRSAELSEYDGTDYEILTDIVIAEDQFAYLSNVKISGDEEQEERWQTGTTHQICVRVWSDKGQPSEWSDPVTLAIAEPLTATIDSTSLVEETIPIDDDESRTVLSLKALPLRVHITGAGDSNKTSLLIRRASMFHMERPDDDEFTGYEGETIALYEQKGESEFVIDDNALMFDDEAAYEILATVSDNYGQSDTAEPLEFEVHWTHQAIMPSATVTIEGSIARIVPRANASSGDVCDIYRLSADRPQRILTNGTFNTVYVDPYPTIGEHGGYRIVYKTVNGDYKTADGRLAWVDISTNYVSKKALIDFNGEQIPLYYNVDESNGWQKDFKQVKYLGGAVQGYWNAGVTQSGSLSTVAITLLDQDMIDAMRRLANYAGVCHVRTLSGASYAADVQVSQDIGHDKAGLIYNYSISINKVDPMEDEAMPYSEWVRL